MFFFLAIVFIAVFLFLATILIDNNKGAVNAWIHGRRDVEMTAIECSRPEEGECTHLLVDIDPSLFQNRDVAIAAAWEKLYVQCAAHSTMEEVDDHIVLRLDVKTPEKGV